MWRLSKDSKQKLAELAELAYKRDLEDELRKLAQRFADYRNEELSCWELDVALHDYTKTVAHELHSFHALTPQEILPKAIAYGLLDESEVPEELLQAFRAQIEKQRQKIQKTELVNAAIQ